MGSVGMRMETSFPTPFAERELFPGKSQRQMLGHESGRLAASVYG